MQRAERRRTQAAAAVTTGTLADLQVGDAGLDVGPGSDWDADRQVRARMLVELLTGTRHSKAMTSRERSSCAVPVSPAPSTCEAADLACPLLLQDCHFDEPVNLSEATAPAIRLPGCSCLPHGQAASDHRRLEPG